MKGDPNPSLPNLIQTNTTHPIVFRRNKTERLDWRKIASLDTEKLIQESDVDTLQEILPEIAFCKAEVEFDHEKTDPGFRKVFQLGQLIIEYLLHNQTLTLEKSITNEQKCMELAEENKKYLDDVKSLKEKLGDAKKELKKRKEMIVSSQNELMGANKDEYDQCPYCTKRFIASVYLFSHMQRRHQGLPLHPMFGAQPQPAQSLLNFKTQQFEIQNLRYQERSQIKTASSQTQTSDSLPVPTKNKERNESSSSETDSPGSEKVDVHAVSGIVDKYLQQKSSAGEALDNLVISPRVRSLSGSKTITNRRQSLEDSERNIVKIKEDLESQWKSLAEKIHQTGMQELKSVLMTEMHKMQEIITTTATKAEVLPVQRDLPEIEISSAAIIGKVEERFQKQEAELQVLRENLQNKMESDLVSIEGKLGSQERFWRSKLRQVEEEYHQQVSKLREDFQTSICNLPRAPSVPIVPEKPNTSVESKSNVKSPCGSVRSSRTPSPVPSKGESVQVNITSPSRTESTQVNIIAHKPPVSPAKVKVISPMKKPTSQEIQQLVSKPIPIPKPRVAKKVPAHIPLETLTPMVKAALNKINATPAPASPSPTPVSALHHEYEEPDDIRKTDEVSDYSSSEGTTSREETLMRRRKEKGNLKHQNSNQDVNGKLSQMSFMRAEVLGDINKQMKELGLNSNGTQLDETKSALAKQRHRRRKREKVDHKFQEERQSVKESVKFSATAETLKPNLVHPTLVTPKKPGSMSPFVKMFGAVKTQGSSWKKRVASLTKRKSAERPVETPKTPIIKTFFNRAAARLKRTPKKADPNLEAEESEDENDTSSSSSSSAEPNMPMLSRSKPILLSENKNKRERELSKERRQEKSLNEHSSAADSEPETVLPQKVLNSRPTANVSNVHMPQILGKKPIARDLLKEFQAVPPTQTPEINKEKDESEDASRDVSGDSNFVSGTGESETSDSDSLSLAFRKSNQDDGRYVSLRPPTAAEHIDNSGESRAATSAQSNPSRIPTTVPGNKTNSLVTRGRLSPRKPETPSAFTVSQVRPSTSHKSNTNTKDRDSMSDDDQMTTGPHFKPSQMYPTSSQNSQIRKQDQTSAVTSKSSPRAKVWTSTPSQPVVPKLASKPRRSPRNNSWDSDISEN